MRERERARVMSLKLIQCVNTPHYTVVTKERLHCTSLHSDHVREVVHWIFPKIMLLFFEKIMKLKKVTHFKTNNNQDNYVYKSGDMISIS